MSIQPFQPNWPWIDTTITPNTQISFTPGSPFQTKHAKSLNATLLLKENLASVVFHMLTKGTGKGTLYVPANRDAIEWEEEVFLVGKWIVMEEEGGFARYRHPSKQEKQSHGLGEV